MSQGEQRAALENAMLAAIVESSDDAILWKDRNGMILSWNKGAQNLYGYSAEEVIGKHISMLIPPEKKGEEKLILDRIVAGEKLSHYETKRVRKDGSPVLVSLSVSPVRSAEGEVVGASAIARDLTDIHMARAARELAERLDAKRHQAMELNDAVLQGLVLAKLSIETGDSDGALEAIGRSLDAARRIIGQLIEEERLEGSPYVRDVPVWEGREPK